MKFQFTDGSLDEEISAALEGNFDFDNPENVLEDDFIIKANGGVLPPLDFPETMDTFGEDEAYREKNDSESDYEPFGSDFYEYEKGPFSAIQPHT